jgi:hypothetical protein
MDVMRFIGVFPLNLTIETNNLMKLNWMASGTLSIRSQRVVRNVERIRMPDNCSSRLNEQLARKWTVGGACPLVLPAGKLERRFYLWFLQKKAG